MNNSRIALIGYVVLAILTGLFLEHVLLEAFGAFAITQPLTRPLGGGEWTYSRFIGLAIAAAAGVYLWKLPKTHDVSVEIVEELRKTSWPSLPETRAATVAVIVASIVSALLLGLFDLIWQTLTNFVQNPSL